MNRTVSIYVRYKDQQGKRCFVPATYIGKASLKPQPGGTFYIRWYEGTKPTAKKVGTDSTDALKAQMRQEAILAGERVPVEQSSPASGVTLAPAVEGFPAERSTQTDALSLKRWRWELELFATVSCKTHIRQIGRADCFAYMKWYQQRKKAPRTVYNRMVSLNVFLKWARHAPDFVFSQRKDGGEIPDYAEKTVDRYHALDLKKFFAACDSCGSHERRTRESLRSVQGGPSTGEGRLGQFVGERVNRFNLGQVVATPGALPALEASGESLFDYVQLHVPGDWGSVDDRDRRENETAIIIQMRIMSVYLLKNGVRIWIITEADRSSTCVLLPQEY